MGDTAPRLNKPEIIRLVSELSGVPKTKCTDVINAYLNVVRDSLTAGQEVYLDRIGILTLKYRKFKKGRLMPNVNYRGELVMTQDIQEHNIPFFKVSKQLKEEIRESSWGNPLWKPDSIEEDE
jgi:DNA-binding protein HU-beta